MSSLYNALVNAAKTDVARFHMPGHKGLPLPGEIFGDVAAIDVTELSYSGNLYTEDSGPIRDAERALAELYNVSTAMFLTGGATQGIMSMLAACAAPGDTVAVHRGSHRSVYNALGLLDLRPYYITEDTVQPFCVGGGIDPVYLDKQFEKQPGTRVFVVTSPNYYGVLSDIAEISAVCKRHGVTLLVDSAHGAHIPFTGVCDNPVSQGADIAVFSAHKTLPALGQSAFLLVSSAIDTDKLRYFTGVFGTSSPSYLLMASIDLARTDLEENGRQKWRKTADYGAYLRVKYGRILRDSHLKHGVSDLCRICIYTGDGYGDALRLEREHDIFCEMADLYNIVFILSPSDLREWQERLDKAIASLSCAGHAPERPDVSPLPPLHPLPEASLTPGEAMRLPSEKLALRKCTGLVSACPIAPYPPGVPIIAPGEKIDKKHIEILENLCYNMDEEIFAIK